MLEILIPETEFFDNEKQEFVKIRRQTLKLEHSLLSLSRWESNHCKAYLDPRIEKTPEEAFDYIRCMCLDKNINPNVFLALTEKDVKEIQAYTTHPMTATTFSNKQQKHGRVMTAEMFYYAMTAYNIPFACEKWHLNRLLALINVCGDMNKPSGKMSNKEKINKYAALNKARRAKYHSRG